jgi:hypothetical protein
MNTGKTLLYLAAGHYLEGFNQLPFDKMYFVEKNDLLFKKSYQNIPPNAEWLCMDALKSIDYLNLRGVKIDCLVSLNEGLCEGGGGYAMFSDEVMGYLSPILKDEFVLICDFSHYDDIKHYYASLNWGYKKEKELKKGDQGFIDPKTFSKSKQHSSAAYGHVFKMKRISRTRDFLPGNHKIQIKIVYGSVWADESRLDAIGLSFNYSKILGDAAYNSQSISDFFQSKPKVFNLKNMSFDAVLDYCKQHNVRHLGLCPWLKCNYQEVIERLQGDLPPSLESIQFYHLNKNDFRDLYTSSADFYVDVFPYLFANLKNDTLNWCYFEDALRLGIGKYIFALCEVITQYTKHNPLEEKPHIRQIKVKFGDLKVHLSYKNDYYKGAINLTRSIVYKELRLMSQKKV